MPKLRVMPGPRRVYKFTPTEVKDTDDAGQPLRDGNGILVAKIKGYASVFGKVDWYDESVEPGAFTKTLAERPNVKFLYQHDPDRPIGRPMVMREDGKGLYVECDVNLEVPDGVVTYKLLKQGAIDGMSIGFRTIKDEPSREPGGPRRILEVQLWEFSVVTFPANEAALVTDVRGMGTTEALVLHHYERVRLCARDLASDLAVGRRRKDYEPAIDTVEMMVDDLLALRDQLEAAGAKEPAEGHSEPGDGEPHGTEDEARALAACVELLKQPA